MGNPLPVASKFKKNLLRKSMSRWSSTTTTERGLDKPTSRETGPDISQSFPYKGR